MFMLWFHNFPSGYTVQGKMWNSGDNVEFWANKFGFSDFDNLIKNSVIMEL